ncbi:unnamed protein product [Chilo suppressalis]|uniref:NADP-dependent oxidoreductase domain-containing protein n=1 Tax=Chilo suppressalis TaxID=168631 RepID=A0ABN8BCU2_CHISP|nr:hypothetical protein evm_005594 [Chilo suppressalis]CAH0404275.1 unnamed protein product [Chilo suppressalis]
MLGACVFVALLVITTAEKVAKFKLNDGRDMPALALGTYLGFNQNGVIKSENKQLRDAVLNAIDLGYRHFDTASIYDTEEEIGEAIKMKIDSGDVKRSDIFLTTKLWNTRHRRDQVLPALKDSLTKLGMDYVDLYLMHWPIGLNEDYSHSDVDFMETWRGLEDAMKQGLTKAIGVSNFNEEQLKRMLEEATVKPAALQIEIHPQIVQKDLVDFAQENGIVVMAYSPFGSLVSRFGMQMPGPKMDDPVLTEIANKYKKTTLQVVLRWLVDRKIVPIAKSLHAKRQAENINIFDFSLSEDEIRKINEFDSHTRFTLPSFWQTHPYYPFDKIDTPIADPFVKSNM